MLFDCVSSAARLNAGMMVEPASGQPLRFYTLMAESANHMLKAKRQGSSGGWSNTISAIEEIANQQTHRTYQAISGISTDYIVPAYSTIPNFFQLEATRRKENLHQVC